MHNAKRCRLAFGIALVLPVFHEGERVGVIKMVVELDHLVPEVLMENHGHNQTRHVWCFVLRGGHILMSSDPRADPLEYRLPHEALSRVRNEEHGWLIAKDHRGEERIMGFAAFHSEHIEPNAYVVYSSLRRDLFDSLWMNFLGLALAGVSLLALCLMAGFFLIQRKVLSPLGRIEAAIRSMSRLARLHRQWPQDREEILRQHEEVEERLREIQKIRTGDQMQLLAHEISTMITRVLRYQSEVEHQEAGKPGNLPEIREE